MLKAMGIEDEKIDQIIDEHAESVNALKAQRDEFKEAADKADGYKKELDVNGVGKLVEMACKLGRQTNPGLELGICGEQGGDPSTVEFCHKIGLTYVSCSPFRVPIARLAAAQAAIKNARK